MSNRGIVVTPRITVKGTELHFPGLLVGIEPADLRFYLLYWDKIDYPNSNIIHIESTPDEQFLVDAGVMTRTQFNVTSGFATDTYIAAQLNALKILNKQNSGEWTLAQTSNAIYLPENDSVFTRSMEVDLYSVLPVPADDVGLADILEFKEKRRDELIRFRSAMDKLYLDADSAKDIPRAKSAAIGDIEVALSELNRVANESWATRILRSLKVNFSISELAMSAGKGAVAGVVFDVAPATAAAVGAVSAAIKIDFGTVPRAKALPDELKDFAYLNSVAADLSG